MGLSSYVLGSRASRLELWALNVKWAGTSNFGPHNYIYRFALIQELLKSYYKFVPKIQLSLLSSTNRNFGEPHVSCVSKKDEGKEVTK